MCQCNDSMLLLVYIFKNLKKIILYFLILPPICLYSPFQKWSSLPIHPYIAKSKENKLFYKGNTSTETRKTKN